MTFSAAVWLLVLCLATSSFDGTWRGTYNSQPTELAPDGSYPETVNDFELRLHESGAKITGEFLRRGPHTVAAQPIQNGGLFGSQACFDVIDPSNDMRWCVQVRGSQLKGIWSGGPQGGPLMGGAGAGARAFKISARRVR